MSYILDALRKSEDERTQQDKVQRESLQGPSYQSENSMSLLPWAVLLLLFSVALAVWWFWPTLASVVAQARDDTNVKPVSSFASGTAQSNKSNANQLESSSSDSASAENITNSNTNNPAEEHSNAGFLNADDALPPGNELKELWQMPVDFQARIPEMNFSFHVYSEKPSSRTIIINGRRLKEGAMVTSKIKLRMITATGVILHAHGRFFHIDVYEQMYVPTSN